MTKKWQVLREQFTNTLVTGSQYKVYNVGSFMLSGVYIGYKQGRYLFQNEEGLFKVNLHKMINPEVKEVKC